MAITITFEQQLILEKLELKRLCEQSFSGNVGNSVGTEYVSSFVGDTHIVSVSNRKGTLGTIEIHSDGVLYKDTTNRVVFTEKKMRAKVSHNSLENYYIPLLLAKV